MRETFSYSMIYEILLNLREYFYNYGRIDDSNMKLDEIIKLICVNFSLAKRGYKFNLSYVIKKSIELFGNENHIAETLIHIFEEESEMDIFYNNDNTNVFGTNKSLNIQPTENELAKKLIIEIGKIDFITLIRNQKYEDFDLVNECFGHFVRENFRNNKEDAQYMTPNEVASPMLDIIFNDMIKDKYITKNIKDFTVMDPSCGVGTLLIECSNHFTKLVESRHLTKKNKEKLISKFRKQGVIGQDKVDRMVRLSKINMLLLGGSMSSIFNGNSITGKSEISNYNKKVDLIFTNPPFGAEYKISELDISEYPILNELNLSTETIPSELLLLDKCINILKDNGYLAIVLPDSFFSGKGINQLYRENILEHLEVRGIIELPDVTFAQAGTRTKTSILYLRKRMTNKKNKIFMANCTDLGYIVKEKVGVPLKISKGINEMSLIAEGIINSNVYGNVILEKPSITTVLKKELINKILKASFYSVNRFKTIKSIENMNKYGFKAKKLSEIVDFVTNERKLLKVSSQVKHISVLHINSDCTIDFNKVEGYKPVSKGRKCEEGDIIFSKINPRIQRIAIIPNSEYELVCSSEFEIMRTKGNMDVYTLCFLLRTKSVISQIEYLTSGTSSSHSRIKRELLESIVVPVPVTEKTIDKFKVTNKKLKQTIDMIYEADKIINNEIKYLESIF